ncbi:natural killer cells antigen CD94-like [Halichoeres trimaculatus]|uniref:natural killer cells antigen CD94-like n=1 Tax=Halichoeres trimaculatus TaxID=147232 RepID=UPI003D9F6000
MPVCASCRCFLCVETVLTRRETSEETTPPPSASPEPEGEIYQRRRRQSGVCEEDEKMSSNIYESPMVAMRFSRGGLRDADQVERVVDIYESGDGYTGGKNNRLTQEGGVHRNPYKVWTLILALLCLLLAAALSVLLYEFYQLRRTHEASSEQSQSRYHNLSSCLCPSGVNGSDHWSRFRSSCYFRSSELKNWTDSRADCVRRGADLVSINTKDEHTFLRGLNEHRASWIGLHAVENKSWGQKWEWKWADDSENQYLPWKTNEIMKASKPAFVYLDQSGLLVQTTDGLRGWICEKNINAE